MSKTTHLLRASALSAAFAGIIAAFPVAALAGQTAVQQADRELSIGVNKGSLIRLDRPAANVFIANPRVADVQVRSNQLIYVFGTGEGETTLFAMDGADKVIYSATVRVANNIDQIQRMLKAALPTSEIDVQTFNGMTFLNGTVPSPEAVEEAGRLVKGFLGDKQTVVNKLQTATPVQVNLQVKIAEVSRTLLKQMGFNIATRDQTGGFLFNLSRGRDFVGIGATDLSGFPSGAVTLPGGAQVTMPLNPATGLPVVAGTAYTFKGLTDGTTSIGGAGSLLGLDAAGAIDALAEQGLVTVLAEPNLTSISGETASFLAGGEFAIPAPDKDGRVFIEYKEYGVGLAFTPTVMSGERISMRVRPEVSELSSAGAITVNGISVPGLTTRRAETTVELGSGQSFMIAGLLRNTTNQDVSKTPGLGDLPIIGALFKSDRFQRQETELVIVVTPYLVKPTNARNIKLPTDGYKAPSDLERWLLGRTFSPGKKPETPAPVTPPVPTQAQQGASAAAPGFSFQ